MDNTIYLINKSTTVSDADVAAMAAACSKQIAQHIAPAHFMLPAPVLFLGKNTAAPPKQARIISIQDECDDPQALGYHTEDGSQHIWGVVGTKTVLSQGAKALLGPYAVSTIVSHEVAEMYIDPFCSGWFDNGQGMLVAYEIGDPVQSDFYMIDGVAVSNFVTGPWFNPMAARASKFDYMGKLKAPFSMSKGGYLVLMREGRTTQKFGEHMPEWLRELKAASNTRTQRLGDGRATAA
jgi:hypothetical protein